MNKINPHLPKIQPEVQSDEQTRNLPPTLGCNLACMQPDVKSSMHLEMQSGKQDAIYLGQERIKCEYGFSFLQINLVALLLGRRDKIITYDKLALQVSVRFGLSATRDSVRGAIMRLKRRSIISSRQAREGTLHGAVHVVRVDRVCPYINEASIAAQSDKQQSAHASVHLQQHPRPSLIQIDRYSSVYLNTQQPHQRSGIDALSEEDIAFHWPNLAQAGFGTSQIRQILERLGEVNKSPDLIVDGLNYAEWELDHGTMVDAKGEHIASPVRWVFKCLSRHGTYRKPKGYISPEELHELEKIETAKHLKELQEQRMELEFETWRNELTAVERDSILEGKSYLTTPSAQLNLLKIHFKTQIWPERIEAESRKGQVRTPESQPTHCGHAHTWELAEGSAPWTPWKEAEPTDGDAS